MKKIILDTLARKEAQLAKIMELNHKDYDKNENEVRAQIKLLRRLLADYDEQMITPDKNKAVEHLYESANGYGMSKEELKECVYAIPNELFDDFIYTLNRIAEKSGQD